MKNQAWLILAFFGTLLTLGCDTCSDLQETCEEEPSTRYLVQVSSVDLDKIGKTLLKDPTSHKIEVCGYHFASGTDAGTEFDEAIEEWNRQQGHTLSFNSTRTGGHIDAFDLIQNQLDASNFDYVNVDSTMPNKCSLPDDLTFAMRTCLIDDKGSKTQWFTIFGNSDGYKHFSDLTSKDFPEDHGILHELGHALGMVHTPNWDTPDKKYISTMQGNLKYLSALDVHWLRNKYPAACPNHKNYVASTLTRFDGNKGNFEVQNPKSLYIDGNTLKDCSTDQDPEFYVAWFNTGNVSGDDTKCVVNSIYLRQKNNYNEKIFLKTWKIATMPACSQDQWKGKVAVNLTNPAAIDLTVDWELAFSTNFWNSDEESTDSDNTIAMDISLYEGSNCSGNKSKTRPEGVTKESDPVQMLEGPNTLGGIIGK